MERTYKLQFGAAILGALFILLESASGQSWVQSSAPYQWSGYRGLASSEDGTRLAAISGGSIYTSINSGISWNAYDYNTDTPWSVAGSADGNRLVVGCNCGGIYTSTNCGGTWISNSVPYGNWISVASSADGTKLAALSWYQNMFYTSRNGGQTWVSNSLPDTNLTYSGAVATSADGNLLVMAKTTNPNAGLKHYGWIYTSTDFGTTWRKTSAPQTNWCSLTCSANGSILAAVADNDNPGSSWPEIQVYVSTNSGNSWIVRGFPGVVFNDSLIACSTNGCNLILAPQNSGSIITSTNFGVTWLTTQNGGPSSELSAVASSADGSKLAAGFCHIYTWRYQPALKLTCSSKTSILSWPSSTYANGYVLQQCDDLLSSNWTILSQPIKDDGTNTSVSATPSSASHFYRLFHP